MIMKFEYAPGATPLNQDEIDDLIIGAPIYSYLNSYQTGAVFILLSKNSQLLPMEDLNVETQSDFIIKSPVHNSRFGHSILESLHQYRQKPLVLLTCYLMSLFIQIVAISLLLPLVSAMGASIPLPLLAFLAPLGILILNVPITPLGLGIGQVAFVTLFRIAGLEGSLGAELCTLLQLTNFVTFFVGGLAALWWPSKAKHAAQSG